MPDISPNSIGDYHSKYFRIELLLNQFPIQNSCSSNSGKNGTSESISNHCSQIGIELSNLDTSMGILAPENHSQRLNICCHRLSLPNKLKIGI